MGKLKLKHNQLINSLERLHEAVIDFNQFESYACNADKDRVYRTYRDSMIQRFEFNVDLFWKYVKRYLKDELKMILKVEGPKPSIREACKAKLITEQDTETILKMIDDRNMSSHIYKEEIANQIAEKISEYYDLMTKYVEKLEPPQE